MGDIIKKMLHHVPEGLMGNHIFLAAFLAVFALDNAAAVQAILLFTLGDMGQGNFCLKIGTKKYKMAFFFVTVQFR